MINSGANACQSNVCFRLDTRKRRNDVETYSKLRSKVESGHRDRVIPDIAQTRRHCKGAVIALESTRMYSARGGHRGDVRSPSFPRWLGAAAVDPASGNTLAPLHVSMIERNGSNSMASQMHIYSRRAPHCALRVYPCAPRIHLCALPIHACALRISLYSCALQIFYHCMYCL